MKIYALTPDLMFKAKIKELAKQTGNAVEFIKEEKAFEPGSIIVIDLMNLHAFEIIRKFPNSCYCYGPHVMQGLFEKAKKLGCLRTYPRSAIMQALERALDKKKPGTVI